ncbi:unnamed protein product [Calicophoron daubneyi]|uniref:SURP motif domain-containing protein n=1 Tax=Calicophoron daubneyi TaxID=300641 RepID=A0AAV2TSL1_CALDB
MLRDPIELVVTGHQATLLDDPEKAVEVNDGKLLVPWCGDQSLLIDRYDCRAHLADVHEHECSLTLAYEDYMSEDEVTIEKMCDFERYLEMQVDVDDMVTQEEETKKRDVEKSRGQYGAVDFSYDAESTDEPNGVSRDKEESSENGFETNVQAEEPYVCPPELQGLRDVCLPKTDKQAQIIERTAVFVARQGNQMEIVLKAKQKDNPMFSFLNFDHELNGFYKEMVKLIRQGRYVPKIRPAVKPDNGFDAANAEPNKSISDDHYELKLPKVDISNTAYASLIQKFRKVNEEAIANAAASNAAAEQTSSPATSSTETVKPNPEAEAEDKTLSPPKAGVTPQTSADTSTVPATDGHNAGEGNSKPPGPSPGGSSAATSDTKSTRFSNLGPQTTEEYERCYQEYYKHYYTHYYGQFSEQQAKASLQAGSTFTDEQRSAIVQEAAKAAAIAASAAVNAMYQARENQKTEAPQPQNTEPTMTPSERGIIDKMAEYVMRNGPEFEELVANQKGKDPRFGFLKPDHPLHAYYMKRRKQMASERSSSESSSRSHKIKSHGDTVSGRGSSRSDTRNGSNRHQMPLPRPKNKMRSKDLPKDRQSSISFKLARPSSSGKLRSNEHGIPTVPENPDARPSSGVEVRQITSCPLLDKEGRSPGQMQNSPKNLKYDSVERPPSPVRFSLPGIPSGSSSGSSSPTRSPYSSKSHSLHSPSRSPSTPKQHKHVKHGRSGTSIVPQLEALSSKSVESPLPNSVCSDMTMSPATPRSLQRSPCHSSSDAKSSPRTKNLDDAILDKALDDNYDSIPLDLSPVDNSDNQSQEHDEQLRKERRRRAAQLVAQLRLTAPLLNSSQTSPNQHQAMKPSVSSATPPPAPDSVPAAVAHAVVASLKRRQEASLASLEAEIKAKKRTRSPPSAYALPRERSHAVSSRHAKRSRDSPLMASYDNIPAAYADYRDSSGDRKHLKHKKHHKSRR